MGHASDSHHDDHHHSTAAPGWFDLLGGIAICYGFSEVVYIAVNGLVPDLGFDRGDLLKMQLSGGLFFVVWALLGRGVFEEFFASAIAREEATQGVFKQAQTLRESSRKISEEVSLALREARLVGIKHRDIQVQEAKLQAGKVLEKAAHENQLQLRAAAETLEEMRVKAEQQLEQDTKALSQQIVSQVIGSGSGTSVH